MNPGRTDIPQEQDRYWGRLNDPSAAARVCGPCGDTVEIYLEIAADRIIAARYYTDGCAATRCCGRSVVYLVEGRTVDEALRISADSILAAVGAAASDHRHCAILAVSTLYRALADYLLRN